jgi:hypothetical protein
LPSVTLPVPEVTVVSFTLSAKIKAIFIS